MKSKSSISSAVSAGSVSDSNEPDLFGPSPSVSESHIAKPSSKSTGPTRRSTTMSEPSTQMDLEELTSSSVGFLARRGPLPGRSEAQKMTAISGRKWLGLLKSYGLAGSLVRTCAALLTNQWASSAAFLTWRASATKPSHLLFQLVPSMPRTDATASGLWPTPATRDYKGANSSKHLAKARGHHDQLPNAVKMAGHKNGKLNPTWVEWLMGFEPGWTDLKPSEMPSSRKSSNKSEGR